MPPRRSTRAGRGGGRGGGQAGGGSGGGGNPDLAAIISAQLQTLLPAIITQVTESVLNHGGGGGEGGGGDGTNGSGGDTGTGAGAGANGAGDRGAERGCTYKEFMACKPKEFDGKGGAVAYARWIEKTEAIMDISSCSETQKVKYASSLLLGKALTWWNTQVQARGREAAMGMTWNEFKALLGEEYCTNNELRRLEKEFWDFKMVRANHTAYTDHFHELARLVPHLDTRVQENREVYRWLGTRNSWD